MKSRSYSYKMILLLCAISLSEYLELLEISGGTHVERMWARKTDFFSSIFSSFSSDAISAA